MARIQLSNAFNCGRCKRASRRSLVSVERYALPAARPLDRDDSRPVRIHVSAFEFHRSPPRTIPDTPRNKRRGCDLLAIDMDGERAATAFQPCRESHPHRAERARRDLASGCFAAARSLHPLRCRHGSAQERRDAVPHLRGDVPRRGTRARRRGEIERIRRARI